MTTELDEVRNEIHEEINLVSMRVVRTRRMLRKYQAAKMPEDVLAAANGAIQRDMARLKKCAEDLSRMAKM